MKTYTFKIKVDTDKVVVACHMQFEQFYDSVKMSKMESLLERYPNAYISASDYYSDDDDKTFVSSDYVLSDLSSLVKSKDLKSYLLSEGFVGFVGDTDFDIDVSDYYIKRASDFIKAEKKILEEGDDENVGDDTAEKE